MQEYVHERKMLQMNPNHVTPDPSSTGLDPKVSGLLCYTLWFITGILFLAVEKQSYFVRYHAMQSTILFGSLFLVNLVFGIIPFLGVFINFILMPISFVLWIAMMIFALQGRTVHIPIVSDIVRQQLQKF